MRRSRVDLPERQGVIAGEFALIEHGQRLAGEPARIHPVTRGGFQLDAVARAGSGFEFGPRRIIVAHARERDPVAYYSNKIDRWFDAHPIAGFLVSAMTVFAFLYGAYAVSVATGVYERYLAKRVEPILIKHVASTYLAIERALRRLA